MHLTERGTHRIGARHPGGLMDGGIVLWLTLVAFTYLQVCVVARDIAHSKGCLTGQVWDSRVGVCSAAHLRLWRRLHLLANPCAGIANSYGFLESHSKDCRCHVGYDWVAANRSCQLNCKKISNSDGAASNINGKCNCKPSFTFINGTLPRCKRTCKNVANSYETASPRGDSCNCKPGFSWSATQNSCEYDCSKQLNTVAPFTSPAGCLCRQGFTWNSEKKSCWISCAGQPNIEISKPNLNAVRCNCHRPTTWVPQMKKCVLHCSLVKGSTQKGLSTTNSCTCSAGRSWNPTALSC